MAGVAYTAPYMAEKTINRWVAVFGLGAVGTPRAEVSGNITDAFLLSHRNWITVKGALEWMMDTYPGNWTSTTLYEKQSNIFDWIARNELHVAPLISHMVRPGEMRQAYEGLLHDKETYTGVVVDWS